MNTNAKTTNKGGVVTMRIRGWIRVVVAAVIGLSALTLSAAEASADDPGPPPESGLQCVTMTPNACWAHQVVFRGDPMLEFATWTKAKWPNGFNHGTNGCSVSQVTDFLPGFLDGVVNVYAEILPAGMPHP